MTPDEVRARAVEVVHDAGTAKDLVAYVRHVQTGKLVWRAPKIRRKAVGSSKWVVRKDGLIAVPDVRLESDIRASGFVRSRWAFSRCYRSNGELVRKVPAAGFLTSERSDEWSSRHVVAGLVHDACGHDLDRLHAQLLAGHDAFLAQADRLLEDYVRDQARPERKKFVSKFRRLAAKHPAIADADPESVAALLKAGPDVVQALADWAKANRADAQFLRVEDVQEAQDLARAEEVLES